MHKQKVIDSKMAKRSSEEWIRSPIHRRGALLKSFTNKETLFPKLDPKKSREKHRESPYHLSRLHVPNTWETLSVCPMLGHPTFHCTLRAGCTTAAKVHGYKVQSHDLHPRFPNVGIWLKIWTPATSRYFITPETCPKRRLGSPNSATRGSWRAAFNPWSSPGD